MLKIEELTPINNNVLVKRLPAESEFGQGELKIILPDTQYAKNRRCQVVKTHSGTKIRRFPEVIEVFESQVQPGDLVEVIIFDGEQLDKYDDPDLERVREDDILCIVKEDHLIPLGNRVVVIPKEIKRETAGGIILPESRGDKPQEGTVVAVGVGKLDKKRRKYVSNIELSPGDEVLFQKFEGTKVQLGKQEFLILKEEDLLCKIER